MTEQYRNFNQTLTRCTVRPLMTPSHKHGLKTCRNVFSQSARKTGTNVDISSVSTFQCSILFNNVGSFNWKSEFRKAENMSKPVTKVKSLKSPSCHSPENSGETWQSGHFPRET